MISSLAKKRKKKYMFMYMCVYIHVNIKQVCIFRPITITVIATKSTFWNQQQAQNTDEDVDSCGYRGGCTYIINSCTNLIF